MLITNLKGRLGADAELMSSKNGNQYVRMRVASNSYSNGENITIWVRVTWVGERAVKMQEHLKKGSFVDVWGELRTSLYDTKNGEKAISYDLMADRVDFVSVGSGSTQANEAVAEAEQPKKAKAKATEVPQPSAVESASSSDDDLPF